MITDQPRNGQAQRVDVSRRASGIDAFLARVVRETGVPGIAVAVHAHGLHIYAGAGRTGRGGTEMTTEHRFHAGCVVKLLLAVVALELAAQERLELDAPLGEPLPELRGTVHGETVHISHLLSHTSGYRGTHLLDPLTRELDWTRLLAYLRAAPQLFSPGSVFSYEHTEAVLLGRIIERATGRDPLELVRETLLEPLGIVPGHLHAARRDPLWAGRHDLDRASGRFVPVANAPSLSAFWNAAFSDFTLSTVDLAVLAEALLPAGRAGLGVAPLSDETRARLIRRVVQLPPAYGGPIRELLPVGFGEGAAEFPAALFGHNGLTHGQCVGLRYSPTEHIAIAIGMNAMLPHLRDHVLEAICAQLLARPLERAPSALELELSELEGRYLGPGRGEVIAARRGDALELQLLQGKHRLVVELDVDEDQGPIVRSPLPQLSIGFFRAGRDDIGMMLGVSAYRRVSSESRQPLASTRPVTGRSAGARS